jgi:hypothetical protein
MIRALADGLWHWKARHPEWHGTSEFSASVGSYLAHEGERTIIVDPLLTEDLGDLIAGEVVVAITFTYHVRDAAEVVRRYGGVVSGHEDVQRRLPDDIAFDPDAGLRWHTLTGTKETPLELPGQRALAFGDRIVGVEDGLRFWMQREPTDERRAWFRRVAVPRLSPLLEIDFDRALVTHGKPVLENGRQALQDALDAEPWYPGRS